jgi:hypothetical protein
MRGVGLASAALALTFRVAALAWPQAEPPRERGTVPPSSRQAPAKPQPIVELAPESERLARLRGESDAPPPSLVPEIVQTEPAQAPLEPIGPAPAPAPAVAPRRLTMQSPKRPTPAPVLAATASPKPKVVTASSEGTAACRPGGSVSVSVGCTNERLATLDRMAAGFFSQSMAHADAAKKELLMSSHTRSAEARGACRSDSCVSDAYLRQMREISAIMEGRDASPK